MSRQARERSPAGIYHIMSRGNNKIDIFCDSTDRLEYLNILHKVKLKHNYELHAYCLMRNHVHLLMQETESKIAGVMKSIGIRYAMYFNKKNNRIGHLFQNRFRSEIIGSEARFLTCARYIHNNPVSAGITITPEDYRWSSFRDYLMGVNNPILSIDYLMGLFNSSPNPREQLVSFTNADNDDRFIEYDSATEQLLYEEQHIMELVTKKYKLDLIDIKYLECSTRNAVIKYIKANTNMSCRGLAKLLNVNKDIVFRA